jgi:hypothetical protein
VNLPFELRIIRQCPVVSNLNLRAWRSKAAAVTTTFMVPPPPSQLTLGGTKVIRRVIRPAITFATTHTLTIATNTIRDRRATGLCSLNVLSYPQMLHGVLRLLLFYPRLLIILLRS